jgi:TetR/AcrR family transcriptional repressor of nem operon
MPAKKTSRDKLIAAALAEMLSRGYSATTVDEICARAAVSKGNFYHFFSTKEELGLAVLDAYYDRALKILGKAPAVAGDPRRQAASLVNHVIDSAGALWGGGCLLGNFALELADTNPTMQKAVSERFRKFTAALAAGIAPLVGTGKGPTAAEIAEQFIVTVEGALILARAHDDWSYVDRALARFRGLVGVPARASK